MIPFEAIPKISELVSESYKLAVQIAAQGTDSDKELSS